TWPGFEEGSWWVQDAAAAVPARLLAPKAGETVADLCAAPGGKTLQLAASGAEVVALDRSDTRLKRLRANLERTGLDAEVVVTPAEDWDDDRAFDAVLLDAPCTATGTFRRNPEVLRATKPADVAKLADVQHRLLDAAAERVKPGGRLVYCVCSMEREEGETQIIAFLRRNPAFRTAPAVPAEIGAPDEARTPEGWLRILPSMWAEKGGVDGFFVARLDRVS
ncbi:MAG: RsmB/NOP family class I SAM-dependent RNA methyltransferase, partial [Caulobacteraceae bacterium]